MFKADLANLPAHRSVEEVPAPSHAQAATAQTAGSMQKVPLLVPPRCGGQACDAKDDRPCAVRCGPAPMARTAFRTIQAFAKDMTAQTNKLDQRQFRVVGGQRNSVLALGNEVIE